MYACLEPYQILLSFRRINFSYSCFKMHLTYKQSRIWVCCEGYTKASTIWRHHCSIERSKCSSSHSNQECASPNSSIESKCSRPNRSSRSDLECASANRCPSPSLVQCSLTFTATPAACAFRSLSRAWLLSEVWL